MSSPPFFPKPLWQIVFWLYLAVLVLVYGTSSNLADADLWHRFALVDYLCHMGHFPPGDAFSYQADYQLVPDHEWGSAFIFYPIYFGLGETGLVLFKLLMLSGTVALIVRAALGKRMPTLLEAFFFSLVILALLSSFFSTLRCEVFTHFFFALWVLWFQREREGRRIPAYGYAFTMILWANMHGGFVLGLAWLGLIAVLEFFGGKDWRRRICILILCLLATLINPFGYDLWIGTFRALMVTRADFAEWAPVSWIADYKTFSGYKLLVIWTIVVAILHLRQKGWKNADRTALAITGLFLAISLDQARHTSLFAIVAGSFLPALFPAEIPLEQIREWKPWLHRVAVRGILFLLPLVLAFRLLPGDGFHLVYSPDNCPIKAVTYLRDSGATGRLLVGFNSGSYALWELRGRMKVSMDGRYDLVYSPATFQKVQHFFAGETDWRKSLSNPQPDAVLVNLPDKVYPLMLNEPGWTQVYLDSTHAVFRPALR